MVQHYGPAPSDKLDRIFAALANPARRAALDALADGARTVSDLAAPHDMSLRGFMKHLRVLQDAGLVACAKQGRSVTCALRAEPIREIKRWLANREQMWSARLDALGQHLHRQEALSSPRRQHTKG
jgi:DNA-binding transcriptional ArsR family regulator